MAFMKVPASASSAADRVPVLGYNAKSGRLALHDRIQGDDGKWCTVKTDVTMQQPAFAIDMLRLEVGYIFFSANAAPLWAMAPYGQPPVSEPPPPATTADGKPLRYKPGFRVPVVSKAIGGVREFAGNSAVLIAGMNELHTEYTEAPEAREGKLPLVKMVDVIEVQSVQGSNFQPRFHITAWVDRLDALLGPRTVPVPGGTNGHAQPVRAATPPTRYAPREDIDAIHADRLARSRAPAPSSEPPDDRWGDEGTWDARPTNGTGRTVARARF